ncbi:hypothetical protein D3Z33_07035 [Senegalia massiliensis]|uniref:Uncharacterized protein n=1 Tax=Senegalia massiliensis TaxID=1720316 RepID=A0A845QXA1_9CLOT|nr:hypothetical protein [Senegalia massiliensis]
MKYNFSKKIKIILIILILLVTIKIFIEEYKYINSINEPPPSNSILVFSYRYIKMNSIYYFIKIIYFYFNI